MFLTNSNSNLQYTYDEGMKINAVHSTLTGFDENSYAINEKEHTLTVLWTADKLVSLEKNTPLFSVEASVLGKNQGQDWLQLNTETSEWYGTKEKFEFETPTLTRNNNITFSSLESGNATLSVYDMLGKLLSTKTIELNKGENKLRLLENSNLPAGIYVYTLQQNKQTFSGKIVHYAQ